MGYNSGLPTGSNPSNAQDVSEYPSNVVLGGTQTIPVVLNVASSVLRTTPAYWYKTRSGAADDNFEFQGVFAVGSISNISVNFYIRVHYTCELCEPCSTGVSRILWADVTDDDDGFDERKSAIVEASGYPKLSLQRVRSRR